MSVVDQVKGKLEHMDEKTWYYVLGGALTIIFIIDFFLIMKPQLGSLDKLNTEITQLDTQIKQTNNSILRLKDYKKSINKFEDETTLLNEKIKLKDDVPLILEKISTLASKNKIKIDQIMPNAEALEEILENKTRTYFSMPISVSSRGGYHEFGRFINNLERSDIALQLESFTISSNSGEKSHQIQMMLSVVLYTENEK